MVPTAFTLVNQNIAHKTCHKKSASRGFAMCPLNMNMWYLWGELRSIHRPTKYEFQFKMLLHVRFLKDYIFVTRIRLLTQVPPSLWLSITAAEAPNSAALRAPARPPDPPPMTRKSNRVTVSDEAIVRLRSLQESEKDRRRLKSDSCNRVNCTIMAITRKPTGPEVVV